MLNFVHVPVNYVCILNAVPCVEWMAWECWQSMVQAPSCVWGVQRQRVLYIILFQVQGIAV